MPMKFAAISYSIKPGFDEEVAEIFSPANFKRASSPMIRNSSGKVVGHIIGTGLFLRGDSMARIVQYDGELDDVARHMAAQDGVHEAERVIQQYLQTPRDTETEAGFMAYFRRSTMTCLAQRIHNDQPLSAITAITERVPAESADALRDILADAWPAVTGIRGGRVAAALAFLFEDKLIRGLVYTGDLDDVLYALESAGQARIEEKISALTGRGSSGLSFRDAFRAKEMRCLSCLSIGMLAASR
jgi:SchA/CurD like domain